ncbi:hypothetical protein GCM10022226_79130 [Sphaerisporangium flaviroseum]|uniref:SH3 domain-containing protein n=1 Tax=Sphaerisporangium flaviroseum TaxID=509199 RepID=A0ABP7JHF2_9ACTN
MKSGLLLKQLGAAAAALALTAGLVGPAQAQVQAAPSCAGWLHYNVSDDYDFTMQGTYLKSGPYGHCGTVTGVAQYTTVYIHCQVMNEYGYGWAWVRIEGTTKQGWANLAHLEYAPANSWQYEWCYP